MSLFVFNLSKKSEGLRAVSGKGGGVASCCDQFLREAENHVAPTVLGVCVIKVDQSGWIVPGLRVAFEQQERVCDMFGCGWRGAFCCLK